MKITISITCCDDDEALTHLSVIRKKMKKELVKNNLLDKGDQFRFSDSNCYGDHEVTVLCE